MRAALACVVTAVIALGLSLGVSAQSAGGAPTTTWQVSDVIAEPTALAGLSSITALNSDDAWAAGQNGDGTDRTGPLVEYWNGTSWNDRTPPFHLFTTNVVSVPHGAVWVLGNINSHCYVLAWKHGTWSEHRFASSIVLTAIATAGPRSAWISGYRTDGASDLGIKPYVARYRDGTWHAIRTPDYPVQASALAAQSASSVWLVASTPASMLDHPVKDYRYVLMHWTGHAWHVAPLPHIALKRGQYLQPAYTQSAGSTGAWVDGNVTEVSSMNPVRSVLLHRTGKSWHVYASPVPGIGAMTSDGHGGLWMTAQVPQNSKSYFVHFASGRWASSQVPLAPPIAAGENVRIGGIALIPGTRSVWAVGTLAPSADSGAEAIIYKYGA